MMNKTKFLRHRLPALLMAALLIVLAAPGMAATTTQYQYPQWGQPVTVRLYAPVYADNGMTISIDTFKGNAKAYVVNYLYDRVKVYSPDEKRAGWVSVSDISAAGQPINIGVVISSSVSVRSAPNTGSALLKTAQNGEALNIVAENSGWYQLQYIDSHTGQVTNGYARTDFIMAQPRFIVIGALTDVYAMPMSGSKKVGQVSKGTTLMVLGEMNDFYAVGLRSAGGFVRMRDVTAD